MIIAYLHERNVHQPQTTHSQRSQQPGTRHGHPRGPQRHGDMERADDGLGGGSRRAALVPLPPWPQPSPLLPRSHLAPPGAAGWSVRSLLWAVGGSRTVTAPQSHTCLCPMGGVSWLFAEQSPAHEAAGTEPGAILRREGLAAHHVPSGERLAWDGPELVAQWLGRRKEGTKKPP